MEEDVQQEESLNDSKDMTVNELYWSEGARGREGLPKSDLVYPFRVQQRTFASQKSVEWTFYYKYTSL
jgi:hypothetical protein